MYTRFMTVSPGCPARVYPQVEQFPPEQLAQPEEEDRVPGRPADIASSPPERDRAKRLICFDTSQLVQSGQLTAGSWERTRISNEDPHPLQVNSKIGMGIIYSGSRRKERARLLCFLPPRERL
jgi:hypothetical protein